MLVFEKTEVTYSVEIAVDEFIALTDYENCYLGNSDSLCTKLMEFGCYKIEYNGHYGSYIYFTITVDDDTIEFKQEISDIIESHLKGMKEYV